MLNNKVVLITGGTGSFGTAFVKFVFKKYKKIKKLIIFSRDEFKQYEMKKTFSDSKYKCMRYFLGDVRDLNRLNLAFKDVDIVIHAAALKQVDTAEYNPFEFINTNIIGAQNVIEAALNNQVERVMALSTDKASSPVNLYGATKLCSDKLFISANNITGKKKIKFSVLRYGNVMFSRGSILPLLADKIKKNQNFEITDERMTRFNIELDQAINLSIDCIERMYGGELFVPKLKTYKVMDLVKAMNAKNKIKIIGIRPGEKIHEEMISTADSLNTFELKNLFVIVGSSNKKLNQKYKNFPKMKPNYSYNSFDNSQYLNKDELKKIVKNYIK